VLTSVARKLLFSVAAFGVKYIGPLNVACRDVSRQRLSKYVPAAMGTHAAVEMLLEAVLSTRSVQRGYEEYK
jgi:hypothetical protein